MFKKFATFEVISTLLVPADATGPQMQRLAHRHEFEYSVRPGYLYVRSRAISSRCNDNYDEFPAEEIKKAFATFIGKPVFVNHSNENHRRARGVVIDAALHEDRNPDGSPDTWVEALMEIDAVRFPRLAKAILAGHIDRTSMGTDVAYSLCSACGNRATSPSEYCQHIPRMKGQRLYRHNAKTGQQEGILIREKCFGLGFFENSLLVEEPADPTAFFLGVDSSGLGKTAGLEEDVNSAGGKDADWLLNQQETGPSHSIPLSHEDREFYRHMRDAGEMRSQMHDHNQKRVVNLADPADLKSHMMESHGWTDDDTWRNSHDQDHPAMMGGTNDDRPLTHSEMRGAHDHEHTTQYPEDYKGSTTLDDSHFHTAARPPKPSWVKRSEPGEDAASWSSTGGHESDAGPNGGCSATDEQGRSCVYTQGHSSQFNHRFASRVMDYEHFFFEAKDKKLSEMTEEEKATHYAAQEKGKQWNEDHPPDPAHVVAHWAVASKTEKSVGPHWYPDSNNLVRHIAHDTHTDMATGAGLTSNYSPQTHWASNLQNAATAMRTGKGIGGKGSGVFASGHQKEAADRMLSGEHYNDVLGGPKTKAFAHLIHHGGNEDPGDPKVVVDRHALSIMSGHPSDPETRASDVAYSTSGLGGIKKYAHATDVYKEAAKHISKTEGREVTPHEVQATTWLTRQRLNEEHDRKLSATAGSRVAENAKHAIDNWNSYLGEHHPNLMGRMPGTGYSKDEPEDVQHVKEVTQEHGSSPVTMASLHSPYSGVAFPVMPYGDFAKSAARDPNDRYVKCDQGHTHWGAAGAAGLLMRHTDDEGQKRYFLQKRAPWVQHGDTYSVPGGALNGSESPEDGAHREAAEELGSLPPMKHAVTHTDDHGGWGYHTVVADVKDQFKPEGDEDYEHAGGDWYTPEEMKKLPLHPGFAGSWNKIGGEETKTSMLEVLATIWRQGAVGSFNEAKQTYENYRGNKSHVPIANNTWIHQDDQGNHHVRYHNTDIMSFSPEGNVTVNRAGWDTNTTNSRINSLLPGGARIGRNPSRARGAPHSVLTLHGETHPYHDGISFNHHTGDILPDNHVRPSGTTVKPPQSRGAGDLRTPTTRPSGDWRGPTQRNDHPYGDFHDAPSDGSGGFAGFHSPMTHSTPTGESAYQSHGEGGEPGANYSPERDRREISHQERQTPGSDSYDSGMSWSPPRVNYGVPQPDDEDTPREGEDFSSWMNRTTPASSAVKCKRCGGKGQIYTGAEQKRQDCPSCKGKGTIGTTAARRSQVNLEELSEIYLTGLRVLAAGGNRFYAEHPSGYRAEYHGGGKRIHIYQGDALVDSPGVSGSDWSKSGDDALPKGFGTRHVQRQLNSWVKENGDEHDAFNHPDVEPMSYADRARMKNLDAYGSKVAFGETVAPSEVDTLRDEECPVCGETSSSFDGKTCQVCGYDAPPQMFRDPDLEKAKSLDLRKDQADQGLGLQPGPEGLTPGQQDANGGMPGEVPGSEDPGSDQVPVDPTMLDENGDPMQGQEPQVDPAQIAQQQMEQLQTGVPLTPDELGPDGEILPQVADQEGINPDDNPADEQQPIDPNALDEQGNPIPPEEQGGEQEPIDPNALDEQGQPIAQETGQEETLPPGLGDPGTPADGVPDLICPACGFQSDAQQPMSTDMDTQAVPQEGEGDGTMAGDVCPNCGQAALISVGEMEQMEEMQQMQGAPV